MPTQDHLVIAGLPRVKMRYGRLVTQRKGVQQKGVDSLIVHDLITLSSERAVATIFLLAGDEDLREGVAASQRLGVQVVLIGIPTSRPNQSLPLIREADEHVLIPDKLLKQFFQKAGFDAGAEAPLEPTVKEDPKAAVADAGQAFARSWVGAADQGQLGELIARKPEIPRALDVQLIHAEEAVGLSLREQQELRHVLRSAFWGEIERGAKEQVGGGGASEGDTKPSSETAEEGVR